MDKRIFLYLKSYSTDSDEINRLLVTAYVYSNDIYFIKNSFLSSFVIDRHDSEFHYVEKLLKTYKFSNLENLIEAFEFVISPVDKVVNGAVYTPEYIRNYVSEQSIKSFTELENLLFCDLSCGCGGFLLTITKLIKEKTNKSFFSIYKENIYGIDITEYSIVRTKILLTLLAIENGEDETEFLFNLEAGNSLIFDWKSNYKSVSYNAGLDVIVGNPPYVTSRNMDSDILLLLEQWEVTRTGHPDLYIPFFQIGYENLNKSGVLGFITVNTFIKSINGRALRNYFSERKIDLEIINFGGEQVFKDRNTYTCLCFLRSCLGSVKYLRTSSSDLSDISENSFLKFEYNMLNNFDGWNLVNTLNLRNFISFIESSGKPFKDIYSTKNGIATLKNDVFKFKPIDEDLFHYYFYNGNKLRSVEKQLCRDIVNANKIKSSNDLLSIREKIIFPYRTDGNVLKIISNDELKKNFPRAYEYLLCHKEVLSTRDKGSREYEEWYAYGRRQSMDINAFKLFFPHICEKPSFVISQEKDLLFYNGIAVISNDIQELEILKLILESDIFYNYIKNTTKDYSSGYISMSKNYIKNFGIHELDEYQKHTLLTTDNPNSFINSLYGVNEFLPFNHG